MRLPISPAPLDSRVVGLDTETALIDAGSGVFAPPLACVTVYEGGPSALPSDWDVSPTSCFRGGPGPSIWGAETAEERLGPLLDDPRVILVCHNASFDFSVLAQAYPRLVPKIFAAYAAGRIECTLIRERLLTVASGGDSAKQRRGYYSLAGLVMRKFGMDIAEAKDDPASWRMRFGELIGTPVRGWPREAVTYALDDAEYCAHVFSRQREEAAVWRGDCGNLRSGIDPLACAPSRAYHDFWLTLCRAWGIPVDARAVEALREFVGVGLAERNDVLAALGILRKCGTKDTKRFRQCVEEAYSGQPPRTDKGNVKTDAETLAASRCPGLQRVADLTIFDTIRKMFIPSLYAAIRGTGRAHARYRVVLRTGRTSASGPNVQNQVRKYFRECFVADPGCAIVTVDIDCAEMHSLAQWAKDTVGESALQRRFAADPHFDPHTDFARDFFRGRWEGMTPEERAQARQHAKAANFGFPGGLGIRTFRQYARTTFGVDLTEREAQDLKRGWLEKFPEMRELFRNVRDHLAHGRELRRGEGARADIYVHRAGFVRGGCGYTQLCNTPFQGLTAAGALHGAGLIARACYADPMSPLYGCRVIFFVHDEVGLMVPLTRLHDASREAERLLAHGASMFTPDAPVTCSASAMYRWSKKAERVLDGGRLVPWDTL